MTMPANRLIEGFEAMIAGLGAKELKDGLTVEEICLHTGKGSDWVRSKLKLLLAAGRLTVGKKRAMSLDGRDMMVSAYKITPTQTTVKKKGKGKK
jgi:hypothetical protein